MDLFNNKTMVTSLSKGRIEDVITVHMCVIVKKMIIKLDWCGSKDENIENSDSIPLNSMNSGEIVISLQTTSASKCSIYFVSMI